jgi:hypothetical protein
VLVEKLLPAELESRGVEGAASVCARALERLRSLVQDTADRETPEAIFGRLGGE